MRFLWRLWTWLARNLEYARTQARRTRGYR